MLQATLLQSYQQLDKPHAFAEESFKADPLARRQFLATLSSSRLQGGRARSLFCSSRFCTQHSIDLFLKKVRAFFHDFITRKELMGFLGRRISRLF